MESNSLTIRPIKPEDNAAIEKVIKTVLEEHGVNRPGTAYYDDSLNAMYEFYTQPGSIYYVGEYGGKIIGGAGVYPTPGLPTGTCEFVKLYILPEGRGKGWGKAFMEQCTRFAVENGYTQAYLETMPELGKAVHLYQKMGFHLLDGPLGQTGHFACTIRMLKAF